MSGADRIIEPIIQEAMMEALEEGFARYPIDETYGKVIRQPTGYEEASKALASEYIQTFPDSPPGNLLRPKKEGV